MAPELINSNESQFNKKADIWSVGCIIYYILSGGRRAFYFLKNENVLDANILEQRKINEEPEYENLVNMEACPQAIDFVKMCLVKDPN